MAERDDGGGRVCREDAREEMEVSRCVSADFVMCSIFDVVCAIILYSILCTFWQHRGEEGGG